MLILLRNSKKTNCTWFIPVLPSWSWEKEKQTQIASVPQGKGSVVKDDVERAIGNLIPLWMFGFIY